MRGARSPVARVLAAALVWATSVVLSAQFTDFAFDLEHPAVQYRTRPSTDLVSALNARLQSGETKLAFEDRSGYLRAVLEALHLPIDSQIAVFSKTSLQKPLIRPS